jgi:hypothetical protein
MTAPFSRSPIELVEAKSCADYTDLPGLPRHRTHDRFRQRHPARLRPVLRTAGQGRRRLHALRPLDGAAPKALEAKGKQICVEGLTPRRKLQDRLPPGLPSSSMKLEAPVRSRRLCQGSQPERPLHRRQLCAAVTARPWHSDRFGQHDSANLKLYRIGDRNIASLLTSSQFLTQLDGYSASASRTKAANWSGRARSTSPDLNKEVVTSFPVDEALPQRKPGVYVLTAVSRGQCAGRLGFARRRNGSSSPISASPPMPAPTASTSSPARWPRQADGRHRTARCLPRTMKCSAPRHRCRRPRHLSAGLMRGTAALTPAVITAKSGANDYVFLDMTRAGFDLSDRGVTGAPRPGAIDVLTWTERGIYRVGETVHVAALARDTRRQGIENLPLTFIFLRPDGVEDRRIVSDGGKLGGYALDLAVAGQCHARHLDRCNLHPIPRARRSAKSFLVDDFVPDRTNST